MGTEKIIFIDRDGTLIVEPQDQQIDSLEKLAFVPGVIPALLALKNEGYQFIMVSNQDGLGTSSYPQSSFDEVQERLLSQLSSQGILFKDLLICPHVENDRCLCRKPHMGLVRKYLKSDTIDWERSCVIGDRVSDLDLAKNMGIRGFKLGQWDVIVKELLSMPRKSSLRRKTKETDITVDVDLDGTGQSTISTQIGFFDHMLEQFAKHSSSDIKIQVNGDLHIDEHHTIEDTALALGKAFRQALGDKIGIQRYGFVLPMDDAEVQVSLDLSGRAYLKFSGTFKREKVGEMPTELVEHFYRSFSDALGATLHIQVTGENDHHMIEASFKCVARALRMAIKKTGSDLPSTKGSL